MFNFTNYHNQYNNNNENINNNNIIDNTNNNIKNKAEEILKDVIKKTNISSTVEFIEWLREYGTLTQQEKDAFRPATKKDEMFIQFLSSYGSKTLIERAIYYILYYQFRKENNNCSWNELIDPVDIWILKYGENPIFLKKMKMELNRKLTSIEHNQYIQKNQDIFSFYEKIMELIFQNNIHILMEIDHRYKSVIMENFWEDNYKNNKYIKKRKNKHTKKYDDNKNIKKHLDNSYNNYSSYFYHFMCTHYNQEEKNVKKWIAVSDLRKHFEIWLRQQIKEKIFIDEKIEDKTIGHYLKWIKINHSDQFNWLQVRYSNGKSKWNV